MDAPTILVVDDTPTNVELLRAVLSSEGFQVLAAEDGASAFALADSMEPDLILLDVMMPDESGFDVCRRLKSNGSTATVPVIFLSALDDVNSKVTGLKLGAVDYVSKPFYAEEVLARVRVHLRIRESNRLLVEKQQAKLQQLRSAQQSLLVRPSDVPGASFAVFYQPLEEAGGDFYDVLPIDDRCWGYFVADVSGHGASAAFLTSAIKALLRQYSGPLFSPEDTMRGVDSVLRQLLNEEQFVTACYARFNRRTRTLSVVSAGHPPVILARATGQVEIAALDGDPLGVFGSVVLQRADFRVAPGDRWFLYTDGVIESRPGAPRQAAIRRLSEYCAAERDTPIEEAVPTIAGLARAGQEPAGDDVLLLAAEVPR